MFESQTQPIDGRTRFCAVYGHPVAHSASPAMQNAGIAALALNWRYLAFDVDPDHLREAIQGAKAMRFLGLNLTVPHKLLALEMVDHLDDSGKRCGAINTIRFEGRDEKGAWQPLGRLDPAAVRDVRSVGFNTDSDAIVRALREELQLRLGEASVLLLGAGGAGSVAAQRLAEEGVRELHLVNRTYARAEELAERIRRRGCRTQVKVGYPPLHVDLVLNATSLGLKPDDPQPYDENLFALNQAGAAYDMIYRPAQTPFLEAAKAAGCRTANGLGMLLYQGAAALELWTGQKAPLPEMRQALEKSVYGA